MEKIVGGILLVVSVGISLWIIFIILKNTFGFSSIPKKVETHKQQSNPSYNSIVEYNYRLDEKREVLVTLDLDDAEIKRYRFVRQSMLEEESRGGYDMNNSIESLAYGILNSRRQNYDKENTLWTRYGNAELYEVQIPLKFEDYDLLFSSIIEMNKDNLAIHLALEKYLKVIVVFKQFVLKDTIDLKGDNTEKVTSFVEFDVEYNFEFQSDSKYSNACLGDWVNVVAIDGIPVEKQ
ncbi:hypothetical protein [Myroides sp. N17-2]|uniref:hypothetical protein n=1 Tax=Myroides sp. N17-2 TaxID=2030799 RepID=UPI000EFC50D0|nr:hypothetical protein [Myroides sp. N17-2]